MSGKVSLLGRVVTFLRLIRFSHTLFAMPYAVAGAFLAARGLPSARAGALIIVAMVAARTAAMTFNRLVDRRFDATNPRTAKRPSVTGEIGTAPLVCWILAASGIFIAASFALNPLAGRLSFAALAVILGYSLTKRFTALSHFILGTALALSPVGAYVAVSGTFDAGTLPAILLGAAVLFWTAGFDILYGCQDVEHDRRERLFSIPAKYGVKRALHLSAAAHALVPVALLFVGLTGGLSLLWHLAVLVVALLLVIEHRLVGPEDLSRVNTAFFKVNVVISLLVMTAIVFDLLLVTGGGGK